MHCQSDQKLENCHYDNAPCSSSTAFELVSVEHRTNVQELTAQLEIV